MPQIQGKVRHVEISDDEAGQRVDNYLMRLFREVPKSAIYRLLRTGQVRVNGGRVKPMRRLDAGDKLRIPPVSSRDPGDPATIPSAICDEIRAAVIHEDENWLVLNKPSGLASHSGSGLRFGVIEALRAARPDLTYVELAHRLDRETSGILICARSRDSLNRIHSALRDRDVDKRYLALLSGQIDVDAFRVDLALANHRERGGERIVESSDDGRSAITDFKVIARGDVATLVEARIHSGRTHQIRVHAADHGHPVAGDERYGDAIFNRAMRDIGLRRMFLHAQRLSLFDVPAADPISFSAPLPAELERALANLGIERSHEAS